MQDKPSYWEQTTFLASFDILIIGSGIVGCAAALHCKHSHPGLRIGIVERGSLPFGASTRNAGFASFGSISEITNDIRAMGIDQTVALITRRKSGLQKLFQLISANALQYRPDGGYELFLSKDESIYNRCLETIRQLDDQLKNLFGGAPFVPDDGIIDHMGFTDVAHVIRHPYEGVLNPGRMMQSFVRLVSDAGVVMVNGFEIQELVRKEDSVLLKGTKGMNLKARYVIIATNAFAGQLIPKLPLRPARNQVFVTQPIRDIKLNGCFHYDHGYLYFREIDGRVLIGGARNVDFEKEYTSESGITEKIKQHLYTFLRDHVLHGVPIEFEHAWSGIIGVGDEKKPIVEMVDERIAVGVRLSGMGVAIGSLVGYEVAQLILSRV